MTALNDTWVYAVETEELTEASIKDKNVRRGLRIRYASDMDIEVKQSIKRFAV